MNTNFHTPHVLFLNDCAQLGNQMKDVKAMMRAYPGDRIYKIADSAIVRVADMQQRVTTERAEMVEKMQQALRLGREGTDDKTIREAMVEILEKALRSAGEAA